MKNISPNVNGLAADVEPVERPLADSLRIGNEKPVRILSLALLVMSGMVLTGCNTTSQPEYARAYQAKNLQAQIVYREVEFSPLDRLDGGLSVEMLSVQEDGTLLLRSEFGIDELRTGQQKLLNGQYLKLLDSDPVAQVARVKTWPKSVFQ